MLNLDIAKLELMGIGDVADFLNVSRIRVHYLVEKYNIPHSNTSAGRIFLKSDIIKFQESRKENMKHAKKSSLEKKTINNTDIQ